MASPLSPLNDEQLNVRSPMTALRDTESVKHIDVETPTKPRQNDSKESEVIDWDDDMPSSPFMNEADSRQASRDWKQTAVVDTEIDAIFEDPDVQEDAPVAATTTSRPDQDKENMDTSQDHSPVKSPLSPLKPRFSARAKPEIGSPAASSRSGSPATDAVVMPPSSSSTKSARSSSPAKSTHTVGAAAETPLPKSRDASLEQQPQFHGRSRSIALDADDTSVAVEDTNIDDTCFSTFSVIPEMTLFAKLGESGRKSPFKSQQLTPGYPDESTPRASRKRVSPSRSPSPTPRRLKTPATDRTTNSFLIDFTQQIERFTTASHQPRGYRSPTKSTTEPNLLSYLNNQRSPAKTSAKPPGTPVKSNSLLNLLDFELPPAPTPRSVPSISVRELESMKSSYLSHISSLKATLTGREAEVESLKRAVADAERRVGEAQEAVRVESNKREHAEHEKEEWEKRGKEVEAVLQNVREEVIRSETEKEDLEGFVEDNRRRAEEAEARALDLEARLASALAALPQEDGTIVGYEEGEVERLVQAQLDAKIEAVSRELHAVYKKKHETKVATLKKSYEARSEKKCAELQTKVDELARQNEELQSAREDDTFSGIIPHDGPESRKAMEEHMATIEQQRAQLAGLSEEMNEVRAQHQQLLRELEQERVEKGELVAAVDEMLTLQSTDNGTAAIEDFRKSLHRPSGLRPPVPTSSAGAESRIGRGAAASGLARPSAGKSKIMSNIERMGHGRTAE